MVDAAEADVVGPAVAADRPDRLLREEFAVVEDVLDLVGLLSLLERCDERVGNFAGLLAVVPVCKVCRCFLSRNACVLQRLDADEQLLADGVLCVIEAERELCVVLEQRQYGRIGAPPLIADEQPAALPTYMRSPNSWLSSLI